MSETETRKTDMQDAQEQSRKSKVKATFKQGALRPAKKRDPDEGEEGEIEITKKRGKMFGALKEWKTDPQKLKEELRNIHG
jgi:major membrane immunogen (membrane-anchored lipoprotein)